jgi:hypothetical protein
MSGKTHRQSSGYRCPASNWRDYFTDDDITAKVKRYIARNGRDGLRKYEALVRAHRPPTFLKAGEEHITEADWSDGGGDSAFLITKPGFAAPITVLCFASDAEAD